MTKEEMAKLQTTYAKLKTALADPSLTPQERAELELHQFRIAGAMMSPLLPVGFVRKFLMFIFVVVAIGGAIAGQPWFLLFLIPAAMGSPRIVGEYNYFRGSLKRPRGS